MIFNHRNTLLSFLCFCIVLVLQNNLVYSDEQPPAMNIYFSVAYQPMTFFDDEFLFLKNEKKYISTSYETGSVTTFEVNLKHRKGFNLGFNLNFDIGYDVNDNMVGKISDVLGFIGYKKLMLRVSHASVNGTEIWTGDPIPGIPEESFPLKYEQTIVDLVYHFSSQNDVLAIGIDYTHYTYGPFINDSYSDNILYDYVTSDVYGFVVSADTFYVFLNNIDNQFKNTGFHIWIEGWWTLGFGVAHHKDNTTMDMAMRSDLTLGALFTAGEKKARFGIGVGYNYTFDSRLIRHGFQARVAFKY